MKKSDYVSEGGKVAWDVFKDTYTPETTNFTSGPTGNRGKEKDFKPMSEDSESFTGPEEGFFAKFGSNEVDN